MKEFAVLTSVESKALMVVLPTPLLGWPQGKIKFICGGGRGRGGGGAIIVQYAP